MRTTCTAIAAAALLLGACGREVRTEQGPVLPAERSATLPMAGAGAGSVTAILYSELDAEVVARAEGIIRQVFVELGDRVEQGQLLARLEDDEQAAARQAAQAAFELARAEHARAVDLRERGAIHQAELERAAFALQSAEAALRQAEVRLEYTRVRAPFGGVVTRRVARVGQNVSRNDVLFRTTSLRPLRAQLRVSELDARPLAPGSPVRLVGLAGEQLDGAVARVASAVDPLSGLVDVLVDIPDPAGLRPGSTVSVQLAPAPAPQPMREP